jgi:hypothetical protein
MTECLSDGSICLRTINCAIVLPQSSQNRQLLAISAATCAECGLLAYGTGHTAIGLLLGAGSSGVLGWCSASAKIDDPSLARNAAVRTVFALVLILMTTTTLITHLRRPHLFHGISGSSLRTTSSHYEHNRIEASGQPSSANNGSSATDFSDAYPGIVLWPKKEIHTRLIAPSPMSWDQKLVMNQHSNPLVIPFDGPYWFFREPDLQPPSKSRQAEGSPEMFDIRSTDWRRLSMEAYQNLGSTIGLDCCGKIQVTIRNADRYPTSIALEVILVDTTTPGRPSQSLGRVDIVAHQKWKPDDHPRPISETLNFPIPSNSEIHRFDEVEILFHLDGYRARDAAKIGIDHFTLVPRGL